MIGRSLKLLPVVLVAVFLAGSAAGPLLAQEVEPPTTVDFLKQFGSFDGLGGGQGGNELELTGEYQVAAGRREGRLVIDAQMSAGWYVYSLTQKPGGPQKSDIQVTASDMFELLGPFTPDKPPKVKNEEIFDNLPVEKHPEHVRWTAPIRISSGADPEKLAISVKYSGQVCQDGGVCIPIHGKEVPVLFGGTYEPPVAAGEIRLKGTHATIRGSADRSAVGPGEVVQLTLSAIPDPTWHVYAYQPTHPRKLVTPTLIVVQPPSGWTVGKVTASAEPHAEETGLEEEPIQYYYEEPVEWSVSVTVPEDVTPGQHTLRGAIGFQTCTPTTCDMPAAASFEVALNVAVGASPAPAPFAFGEDDFNDVAKLAAEIAASAQTPAPTAPTLDLDSIEVSSTTESQPVALVLGIAFVAGFVLNFMPCVLPVIGLKVMSFVQQSGENRARIFMLNLWYCAGLMSVFMVLATLAVFMGLSWGEQFNSTGFNVFLAAVVFAFALSFLGVWEVPIPGFVGSGKVNNLATKEGASGAFFKGVLTTVLATPCSGPMLGPALTWAVSQTPFLAYLGFASVGLGMASPFILIGIFPKLVSFLPKPGAWMETFKHIMGFVLLGTVVLLLTFIPGPSVVPTVTLMIGLWAALWAVGRISITAGFQEKLRGWLLAGGFATLVGLFAFLGLQPIMQGRFENRIEQILATRGGEPVAVRKSNGTELPWEPFTLASLERRVGENKTILIDFTADT